MLYSAARPHIKSGDLLAFSHFGWKSLYDLKIQAVRMFTQSEYSHVGIAWVIGDRVFCLEAVEPKIRIYPLSKLGEFYWAQMGVNWTPQLEEFALSVVGEEYSQWQAIQSFFETPKADKMWQCCEYARAIYEKAGIPLHGKYTPTGVVRAAQMLDVPFHIVKEDT